MDLEFKIPEGYLEPFIEGVLEAVEKLGFTYDCDETAPAIDNEVIYKLINVRKKDANQS